MTGGCEWRHVSEACAEDFGDLWKVRQSSFSVRRRRWLSELAEAARVGGQMGKVVIEKLCLSLLHVEKPFNSKVIKSFVPELRSRKVFRVSGFLCYIYMCDMNIMNVLRTGMNMYISHIHVWLCNRNSWSMHQPKRCEYEDNSSNILSW